MLLAVCVCVNAVFRTAALYSEQHEHISWCTSSTKLHLDVKRVVVAEEDLSVGGWSINSGLSGDA